MSLIGPIPLASDHDCTAFDSGIPQLDDWLKRRALAHQLNDAARTSVICDGSTVLGYFALAAASISTAAASGRFRRNMPDPIPVILLARLALDRELHGKGYGSALFRDAVSRALAAADIIGARGLIVHAISDDALGFYEAMGMRPSGLQPMTLMVTCAELRRDIPTRQVAPAR